MNLVASHLLLLGELNGKALAPLIITISGICVLVTGGLAALFFIIAKGQKKRQRPKAGIIVCLVFGWLFVVAALLCAGCGVSGLAE